MAQVEAIRQLEVENRDLLNDCRWAMSMLVNGIEGRLMDIYDNDLEKVEKASRRMPAFRRAVLWLDAHREGKERDHAMERVTGSIGSGD
jgi:hypothetical protein